MRARTALAAGAVAFAGAGAAAGIALAQAPATATFDTNDAPSFANVAGGGNAATIAVGGRVTFRNGPGGVGTSEEHDVSFDQAGNPAGGVTCVQTAGGVSSGLRIPPAESDGQWAGECTFTQPGTYTFICDPHALEGMTGTVTVVGAGGGTTPPPAAGPGPGTQGTGTQPAPAPPAPRGAQPKVTVEPAQRGDGVHALITGARRGGRAKVELLGLRGELGLRGDRTARAPAGSVTASITTSGGLDVVVPLSATARKALAARGRLALAVRVTAPPVQGTAAPRTFAVALRRQATPPSKATVDLKGNLFTRSTVTVRKGGSVTWRWRDGSVPHDVRGTGFRSEVQRSGTYRRAFPRAGTFTYICTLHDGMKGRVVVR